MVLDDRIHEDDSGKEPRMHECEITEDVAADGMPDADNWHGHLFSEDVDHVKEISWVVTPGR